MNLLKKIGMPLAVVAGLSGCGGDQDIDFMRKARRNDFDTRSVYEGPKYNVVVADPKDIDTYVHGYLNLDSLMLIHNELRSDEIAKKKIPEESK